MPKSQINRGPDFVPEQIIPIPVNKSVVDYHFIKYEPDKRQELVESISKKQQEGLIESFTDEESAFIQWQGKNY